MNDINYNLLNATMFQPLGPSYIPRITICDIESLLPPVRFTFSVRTQAQKQVFMVSAVRAMSRGGWYLA